MQEQAQASLRAHGTATVIRCIVWYTWGCFADKFTLRRKSWQKWSVGRSGSPVLDLANGKDRIIPCHEMGLESCDVGMCIHNTRMRVDIQDETWVSFDDQFSVHAATSFCFRASSSSGVRVVSCSAWMPPSCAISSFIRELTMRWRASWVLPLKSVDVMTRLGNVSSYAV